MQKDLIELCQRLNYEFQDIHFLNMALSHRSVGIDNNERLEFLGDAVLSFLIASELYQRYPEATEGELSRMRSALVNGQILVGLAKTLEVSKFIRLGIGELKSGGRHRQSILADAVEAIIGAIYLDGGIEKTRIAVLAWYGELIEDLSQLTPQKDAKSALQEWLQAHKLPLPVYQARSTGEPHAQTFYVICRVKGLPYEAEGESTSRRKAEQIAAERYLELLEEN